jgi:hypothetical protein
MKTRPKGTVWIYSRWAENYNDRLRPAYDSAEDAKGVLTDYQVSTLRSMINRYVRKCHQKNTGKHPPSECAAKGMFGKDCKNCENS